MRGIRYLPVFLLCSLLAIASGVMWQDCRQKRIQASRSSATIDSDVAVCLLTLKKQELFLCILAISSSICILVIVIYSYRYFFAGGGAEKNALLSEASNPRDRTPIKSEVVLPSIPKQQHDKILAYPFSLRKCESNPNLK